MATFTWIASTGASLTIRPVVRRVTFGDGYEQRVTFGLNPDPKEWTLSFANRTDAERENIVSFLEARGGVESFDWTPPRGSAGKYICEEWQVTLSNCNNNQVQATFREVFEP